MTCHHRLVTLTHRPKMSDLTGAAIHLKVLLAELHVTQRAVAKVVLESLAVVGDAGDDPGPHFTALEELASSVGWTGLDLLRLLQVGVAHERIPWPWSKHDERRTIDKLLVAIESLLAPFGTVPND
jgi:hypothetical protein